MPRSLKLSPPHLTCPAGSYHAHAAPPPWPLPELCVHLTAEAVLPALTPTEPDALVWECPAVDAAAAIHPSYTHTLTLSNNTRCPLAFGLSTEGPFTLLGAAASVPQDDGGTAYRWVHPHSICTCSMAAGLVYTTPATDSVWCCSALIHISVIPSEMNV